MLHVIRRRALLVVDVQNEYVDGKLVIEHPPIEASLDNIARAMDAACANAIDVLVTTRTLSVDAPVFAYGTTGAELHHVVARRRRAHLFERSLPGVFFGTDLSGWLIRQAVETITIVGFATQSLLHGVISDALKLGVSVEFLPDASGYLPCRNRAGSCSAEEIHRVMSVTIHSSYAAVLSTAEWIDMLKQGSSPERDNILDSNRRALLVRSHLPTKKRD